MDQQPHLLVIEDDESVCELLFSSLRKDDYRVTVSTNGEEGLRLLDEDPPDLLILDLNLPGMNGLDVCRTMRRDPWMSKIPVLMLTGQAEEDDIITGLEVGADDYMTKPFSPKVLRARAKTLLRRGKSNESPAEQADEEKSQLVRIMTLGQCLVQAGGQSLSWAETFSPAQRQLMSLLTSSKDGRVSQEEVQLNFWPDSSSSRARSSFDSLLSRVRRTLEESLQGFDSKQHLVVKRGFLCLEHVRIDAHEFRRLARKGMQHAAARDLWRAEMALSSALSLWQGTFLPGDFGCDAAVRFQDELEQLYLDVSQVFARVLAESGRFEEAIKLLRYAQRYNPTEDSLARLLYQLLLVMDQSGQARQALSQYTALLEREKFSDDEINSIVEAFPEGAPVEGWLHG